MPHCPGQCGRSFKTKKALKAHLNSRFVTCQNHFQEVVDFAEELQRQNAHQAQSSQYTQNEHTNEPEGSPMNTPSTVSMDLPMDVDSTPAGRFVEEYEEAAAVHGEGITFMSQFDYDRFAGERVENLYYPFASREEWDLASFLLRSDLSMSATNDFLSLSLIKSLRLSFCNAKRLRGLAEMLPTGPQWQCKPWPTVYPVKKPISLYYRDPLECIQSILYNPLVQKFIQYKPFRLYQSATKAMRIYTEWLSGDAAWSMQEKLPEGATLLGVVLSSDKTNISAMTGGRMSHPLLISLTNLLMDYRSKGTNNAFYLLAQLPIPKFVHKDRKIRGVLENRVMHECLDFVLGPLKKAAQVGCDAC